MMTQISKPITTIGWIWCHHEHTTWAASHNGSVLVSLHGNGLCWMFDGLSCGCLIEWNDWSLCWRPVWLRFSHWLKSIDQGEDLNDESEAKGETLVKPNWFIQPSHKSPHLSMSTCDCEDDINVNQSLWCDWMVVLMIGLPSNIVVGCVIEERIAGWVSAILMAQTDRSSRSNAPSVVQMPEDDTDATSNRLLDI
jgi:hypothetical protein